MKNSIKIAAVIAAVLVVAGAAFWVVNNQSPDTVSDSSDAATVDSTELIDEEEFSFVDDNEPYVYEFEAASADECSSLEQYDEEYSVCYFECDTDQECDNLLADIEQELDGYLEEYSEDSATKVEKKPESTADIQSDADYSVSANEVITLTSGQASDAHTEVWQQIKAISPDSFSDSYIETFRAYNDAEDGTAAYVEDPDENGKWIIAVNLAAHNESSRQEQILTFVHELAHIVTLNNDQRAAGTCSFETQEGCFGDESVISGFVDAFWSKEDIATATEGGSVYDGKEDNFVTEYAATNPGEDIAESFAYYTVKSDYSGDDIASKKQAFFDTYDEMKSIKQQMRKAVLKQFARARLSN